MNTINAKGKTKDKEKLIHILIGLDPHSPQYISIAASILSTIAKQSSERAEEAIKDARVIFEDVTPEEIMDAKSLMQAHLAFLRKPSVTITAKVSKEDFIQTTIDSLAFLDLFSKDQKKDKESK